MRDNLSYLAGLTDGEGTLNLFSSGSFGERLSRFDIYNTNEKVIDWVVTNFGGFKRTVRGRKQGYKTCYTWSCPTGLQLELLTKLLPFLIVKTRQAELVIEFRKMSKRGRLTKAVKEAQLGRDALIDECRLLNRRGHA